MKRVLLLCSLLLASAATIPAADDSAQFAVKAADCVIVVPAQRNAVIDYAVQELQLHLKLISGVDVPVANASAAGQFPFHLGARPDGDTREFAAEEARWTVTPRGIWLYGKD